MIDEYTPPSLRHFAFRVSHEDIKRFLDWMQEKGIEPMPFGRPYQGNASVYCTDPDGNSLELMCFVEVPESLRSVKQMLSIPKWEALLEREMRKVGREEKRAGIKKPTRGKMCVDFFISFGYNHIFLI